MTTTTDGGIAWRCDGCGTEHFGSPSKTVPYETGTKRYCVGCGAGVQVPPVPAMDRVSQPDGPWKPKSLDEVTHKT